MCSSDQRSKQPPKPQAELAESLCVEINPTDMTWPQRLALTAVLALPVGFVGATAFNPDSGFVLHSVVLWRTFGPMVEIGTPLLLLLATLTAITSAITGRSRRPIHGSPAARLFVASHVVARVRR